MATYLVNREPSRAIQFEIPYSRWFHKSPDYSRYHPFGCKAYSLIDSHERPSKFSSVISPLIFVGYSKRRKAFQLIDPHTLKLKETDQVRFDDTCFPFKQDTSLDFKPQSSHVPIMVPPTYGPITDSHLLTTSIIPKEPVPCLEPPSPSGSDSAPMDPPSTASDLHNASAAPPLEPMLVTIPTTIQDSVSPVPEHLEDGTTSAEVTTSSERDSTDHSTIRLLTPVNAPPTSEMDLHHCIHPVLYPGRRSKRSRLPITKYRRLDNSTDH
ncbi:hypothetical protein KL920_005431, partial [Ogataea angusta]